MGLEADGRIAFLTQRAADLLGCHREEMLGRPVTLVFPKGAELLSASDRCIDLVGRRKDGTSFTAEVSAGAGDLDGRRLTWAVVRDVTEHREAETLFRRLVETAHDERTPE